MTTEKFKKIVGKARSYKQCDAIADVLEKAFIEDRMDEDSYEDMMKTVRHQRTKIEMKRIVAKMNANPNTPTVTHDKHGRKIKVDKL